MNDKIFSTSSVINKEIFGQLMESVESVFTYHAYLFIYYGKIKKVKSGGLLLQIVKIFQLERLAVYYVYYVHLEVWGKNVASRNVS